MILQIICGAIIVPVTICFEEGSCMKKNFLIDTGAESTTIYMRKVPDKYKKNAHIIHQVATDSSAWETRATIKIGRHTKNINIDIVQRKPQKYSCETNRYLQNKFAEDNTITKYADGLIGMDLIEPLGLTINNYYVDFAK